MVLCQMDAGKALTAAAAKGNTSEVQRILEECRVHPDTRNEFGRTALQVRTRLQNRFGNIDSSILGLKDTDTLLFVGYGHRFAFTYSTYCSRITFRRASDCYDTEYKESCVRLECIQFDILSCNLIDVFYSSCQNSNFKQIQVSKPVKLFE